MDRVLKRVGITKKSTTESKNTTTSSNNEETNRIVRRRRHRSKSSSSSSQRRRPRCRQQQQQQQQQQQNDNKKSRGLFCNIDWDVVKDCKSCKSRALLSKKFCNRKTDNELYRSDSFKFERFLRNNTTDDLSPPIRRKISLCEEYSLPLDDLAQLAERRRPNSIAVVSNICSTSQNFSELITSSFEKEGQVVALDTYSIPKDTHYPKQQQAKDTEEEGEKEEGEAKFCFTSPDKEYSQPYTTEESSNTTSDDIFTCPSDRKQSNSSNNNNNNSATEKDRKLSQPLSVLDNNDDNYNDNGEDDDDDDILSPIKNQSTTLRSSNTNNQRRHPSPYYYGDLFKYKEAAAAAEQAEQEQKNKEKQIEEEKSSELLSPSKKSDLYANVDKKNKSKTCSNQHGHEKKCKKHRKHRKDETVKLNKNCNKSLISSQQPTEATVSFNQSTNQTPQNIANIAISLPANDDDGLLLVLDDDMTRQRHVYETAFDCRISKSDDDLDQIERVTNHPILVELNKDENIKTLKSTTDNENNEIKTKHEDQKDEQQQQDNNQQLLKLSQDIQNLQIEKADSKSIADAVPTNPPTKTYVTPTSPPSTAPLPSKFPGKESLMIINSIRSAPNLQPYKTTRLIDLNLPVKQIRLDSPTQMLLSSGDSMRRCHKSIFDIEFGGGGGDGGASGSGGCGSSGGSGVVGTSKSNILEIKGRPNKSMKEHHNHHNMDKLFKMKSRTKNPAQLMLQKNQNISAIERIQCKYSSTESVTISSSWGSMESIKSSTSEGNRSTTSSSSRHSASLSSHSSDSGNNTGTKHSNFVHPQMNFLTEQRNNKLHILSPISDKSSQEPMSESSYSVIAVQSTTSDGRHRNSQKNSPVEMYGSIGMHDQHNDKQQPQHINITSTTKKRVPQNRNVLSLNFHDRQEIQGSDSGISIQSREGVIKPHLDFLQQKTLTASGDGGSSSTRPSSTAGAAEYSSNMPKLRRHLQLSEDTACTTSGGSATSIDYGELPFDMPKLRRNRTLQPESSKNLSPNQSQLDLNTKGCASKLTLNLDHLGGCGSGSGGGAFKQYSRKGLALTGLQYCAGSFNDSASTSSQYNPTDFIDSTQVLEKQGWYHGSITRVEAEHILRTLREGSFLVRNSESVKNDYSLSLKSAKGFMHMRIQKNSNTGCYILGQFSKPFATIPEMIRHYSLNRLPIRGADHMCLLQPVIAQLL